VHIYILFFSNALTALRKLYLQSSAEFWNLHAYSAPRAESIWEARLSSTFSKVLDVSMSFLTFLIWGMRCVQGGLRAGILVLQTVKMAVAR
jgi:hypothetical protein